MEIITNTLEYLIQIIKIKGGNFMDESKENRMHSQTFESFLLFG